MSGTGVILFIFWLVILFQIKLVSSFPLFFIYSFLILPVLKKRIDTMARNKYLTREEEVKITTLKEMGLSNRKIAAMIHRSEKAVRSYLKKTREPKEKRPNRRNSKVSLRQKNCIVQEATKNQLSASQIVDKLQLPVGKRRVQQILHNTEYIKYKKPMKKPLLKQKHKENRLSFAKIHMSWVQEWRHVVFSDEKNSIWMGPTGSATIGIIFKKKTLQGLVEIIKAVASWYGVPFHMMEN